MTSRVLRGPLSHVARGTAYEKQCQLFAARHLKLNLTQVGGAGDEGIDLRGTWQLDVKQHNVIAQCKCYKKKVAPNHVRELVGTIAHYRQHAAGSDTLAILFTSSGWSTQTMFKAEQSTAPILLLHLEPEDVLQAEQVEERYAKGRSAKNGHIDLLCKGAVANTAWSRALGGQFAIQRPILHTRPSAPVGTEFTYNGISLCAERA